MSAGGALARSSTLLLAGALAGVALTRRSRTTFASDTRWFEMSNELLAEASLDGYFLRLSKPWEQTLGWTREELMSRPFREFVHPDDLRPTRSLAEALDQHPGEALDFENRYRTKDGSYRWLQWRVRSDEQRKYAVARDVTEHKRLEQERQELLARVEAMARTDPTTGLPNRRAWEDEVRQAIARAERLEHPLTLGLVDLDGFKAFNDTHGHPAGDELLAEATASWRLALRVTDFIARYGGDEFALLLPDCPADEASSLLGRFRVATPRGQTVSVGIAHWDRSEPPERLVARADAALYAAKQAGRDRVMTSLLERRTGV